MTHELLKKLKDAGFPGSEKWIFTERMITFDSPWSLSLEKVIEACGDRFKVLQPQSNNNWYAGGGEWSDVEYQFVGRGKNPLEAAINLYVELNMESIMAAIFLTDRSQKRPRQEMGG